MERGDEMEMILAKFGDEHSTLLDQFERLSFEVQLNQAILRRSLSEPSVPRTLVPVPPVLQPAPPPPQPRSPPPEASKGRQRRRSGLGFQKILKKLIKPMFRRRSGGKKEVPDPKDPSRTWMAYRYSRSMRL